MIKISVNEPCPCGSGKKYKKCCGLTPQQEPTEEIAVKMTASERKQQRIMLQKMTAELLASTMFTGESYTN